MFGCGAAGLRNDANRPRHVRGERPETHLVVARLVAQTRRNHEIARGLTGGNLDTRADHELPLEDRERFGGALLFEVDRLREHDLQRFDAGRRLDPQNCRNQRGITRLIGLNVEAFGKTDAQREASDRSRGSRPFDEALDVDRKAGRQALACAEACDRDQRQKKRAAHIRSTRKHVPP